MQLKRREFLGASLAGTAGVLLSGQLVRAATADVDPVALVPLGKNLKFCRIGAGTGMNGGNRASNQKRMGEKKFTALLNQEWEQGIRYFDCADLYGTHPWTGQFLKSKPRENFQLVSKVWFLPRGIPEKERPDADVCIERFLKELQTDYIDLVQIHCMTKTDWPREMRKQMDIMEKLKEKGLIRAHGVSCHSLDGLKAAANEPWVDVIHARINPTGASMDATAEEVVPVLKQAKQNGKGIIGMKICGAGTFSAVDRARSIKWVMNSGVVDVLIAGFEQPEQVAEFKGVVEKQLVAIQRRRQRVLV